MKSLLFFILIIGGAVAWVYVAHPEVIATLTSPETRKNLQAAMSTVDTARNGIAPLTNAAPQ